MNNLFTPLNECMHVYSEMMNQIIIIFNQDNKIIFHNINIENKKNEISEIIYNTIKDYNIQKIFLFKNRNTNYKNYSIILSNLTNIFFNIYTIKKNINLLIQII
ncbi:hypothetical protein AB837_00173 [bacterium AB1]|nr:hypothetical protein AB837_00173 [bacterium AB1]